MQETRRYWVDPNGKLYSVGPEKHLDFAKQYLMKNFAYADSPTILYREELYKKGWIRAILIGYMGQNIIRFNLKPDRKISSIQMDSLKELAIENDVLEIVDDTHGTRYDV